MMNPMEDLKYGGRALEIRKFRDMDHEIFMSKVKDVEAMALDEIAGDVGQLQHIAADDSGKARVIMSGIKLLEEFGISAHFAGFAPDGSPTIWIDADTGIVNLAQVNFNGATLLDSLVQLLQEGWITNQQATVGSETRVARIGLKSNGTYPEQRLEFCEPGSAVTIPNGDFASGDMTGWESDYNTAILSATAVIVCMTADSSGNIYIGAGDSQVYKWDGATLSALGTLPATTNLYAIAVDSSGNVYAAGYDGTANTPIRMWDGNSWTDIGAPLADATKIYALAFDTSENLYAVGDFISGSMVRKWDGSSWTQIGSFTDTDGQAIAVDSSGNVYVAGDFATSDVWKWNGSTWAAVGTLTTLTGYALAINDGVLYAGGGGGVYSWDGATWTDLGLDGDGVAFAFDSDGNLYAVEAVNDKLMKWNGDAWKEIADAQGALTATGRNKLTIYNDVLYAENADDELISVTKQVWSGANNYAEKSGGAGESVGFSSAATIAVTAGQSYNFSVNGGGTATDGTIDIQYEVEFYDSEEAGGAPLSTVIIGEVSRDELAVETKIAKLATAPTGATHAKLVVSASADVAFSVWFDDFEVNAFSYVALVLKDDDAYIENNGVTRGISNPKMLYAKSEWTAITNTSETEIWSVTLPANFFATKKLGYRYRYKLVQSTTSSRTVTARHKVAGSTVVSNAITSTTARTIYTWYRGEVTKSALNAQWNELLLESHNIASGSLTPLSGGGAASAETEANPITISFTLQMNSNSSFTIEYFGVEVYEVENVS